MNSDKDLIAAADDLLAKLPFNENKVKLGLAVQLFLPMLSAFFPPILLAVPFLHAASIALTAVGLVHDGVKAVRKSRK